MATLDAAFWFEIADETRPLSDIPADVVKTVLDFLNAANSAAEVGYAVPMLDGWTPAPVHSVAIFNARGAGFTSLDELWRVAGLGPARFVEVIRSIAKTDVSAPALFAFTESTPQVVHSSSETELKFEYEFLLPGPLQGTMGQYPPPAAQVPGHGSRGCAGASSCSVAPGSYNLQLQRHEAQIDITGLLLTGENDDSKVSIRMDHRLRPYDFMQPMAPAPDFQFPAVMQLNNSMIIDIEIKPTGQQFSLVARDVPCQVGRCTNWPPHKMLLFATEPLVYYDSKDPLGQPILKIRDATTFLRGPEKFLSVRAKFDSYEFVPPTAARGLPAIILRFDCVLGGQPTAIDHYLIQRSHDPSVGEGGWADASGPVMVGEWIDANPPPGPLYYRLVPVALDALKNPYEGFGGQVLRVEPADSIFR